MTQHKNFVALTPDSLPSRLGGIPVLQNLVGKEAGAWRVREVGDGNLNLVFIVEGPKGSVVVKQALPYVRLVGESWPLPLKRSFFEHNALTRFAARDPGRVPEIYHVDDSQALVVMEFLGAHTILRHALIEGRMFPRLAEDMGLYLARCLFRGSDLHMSTRQKKADLALFADNVELCDITENLVFSDPYFSAPMNRHTSPELDGLVGELRADRDLKVQAQILKHAFSAQSDTLCHGDLHTGSIMVSESDTRVIDPEFAFYGPFGFDVGMLLANYWMSFFAQRGHEAGGSRDGVRAFLLQTLEETWNIFATEFGRLWRTERNGILYQRTLFEAQGDALASEQALQHVLRECWTGMLGFAGIEMHRRILGLAHNADFEKIEDRGIRAACEARALRLGRHLAVNRHKLLSLFQINQLARQLDTGP